MPFARSNPCETPGEAVVRLTLCKTSGTVLLPERPSCSVINTGTEEPSSRAGSVVFLKEPAGERSDRRALRYIDRSSGFFSHSPDQSCIREAIDVAIPDLTFRPYLMTK